MGAGRYSLIAIACLATSIANAGPSEELRPPKDRPPTAAERAATWKHYRKARKAFDAGDYRTALDELRAAYDAQPKAEYLYAIAQVHLRLGHCAEATTYLERYLATRPNPTAMRTATQAIDDCKPKEPPPTEEPAKLEAPTPPNLEAAPEPEQKPEPQRSESKKREPKVAPVAAPKRTPGVDRWFSDKVGTGFLIGGAALGGASGLLYLDALSELDAAEGSPNLEEHIRHFDTAGSRRLYSLITAGAGVAAATYGLVHLLRYRSAERSHVAVVPTGDGALAVVTGRF